MGRRKNRAGREGPGAAQGVVSDSELFQSVTKDLAARGLLGRVHVIKAGSVEVQLLVEDRPQNNDQAAREDKALHDEILFASAGN